MKRLFLFLVSFFLLGGSAEPNESALRAEVFPTVVKQGDVCFIRAFRQGPTDSVYATFRSKRLPVTIQGKDGAFGLLLGIDMDTPPGGHEIKIEGRDKSGGVLITSLLLKVDRADFGIQTLSLPSSMVDLDPKTLERVNREANRLEEIFRKSREEKIWSGPFVAPLTGEMSSPFGVRRFINGQPKSAHTGVDLEAAEGTSVLACNRGVVVLCDELFFTGNTIILDHGGGIYSMYFHLSRAAVSEGEAVEKGAIIGNVGSTGRSTGPHLHWGMRMNDSRVDPFALLKAGEYLRE